MSTFSPPSAASVDMRNECLCKMPQGVPGELIGILLDVLLQVEPYFFIGAQGRTCRSDRSRLYVNNI